MPRCGAPLPSGEGRTDVSAARAQTASGQEIERKIARLVLDDLFAAGYRVTVCDGEENVITREPGEGAVQACLNEMFHTDEAHLFVKKPGGDEHGSFVSFYWGNAADCIHDYGNSLEPVLFHSLAVANYLRRRDVSQARWLA